MSSGIKSRLVQHRTRAFLGVILSITLLTVGCSSGDGGGGTARPAGDTAAEVKAAEAAVAEATSEPTQILITEPLKEKPIEGQTMVYLSSGDPSANQQEALYREALEAVKWKLEVLPVDNTNPATTLDAMKTALTLTPKPKVVLFVAQPKAVWQSVIPAYEKAGVGLIANVVGPLEIEGPVVANTNGPPYIEQMHSDIANWFIADSEGTGKVLKYEVNDLPVLSTGNDVFRETVKEGCSQCSVKVLAGSIAQASSGEGVPAMISALQADPSIKYLITDYSAWFSGIRSALNAAGLDDVKVGSTSALPTTLSDVKSGAQQATTLLNNAYLAWVGVDAALRFTAGQPVGPEHSNTPVRLITSDTDFAIPEEPSPVDYQTQFKKLWNVG